MNLFEVLPDFEASSFGNILPSLERHKLTVADLLVLDAAEVAKRASIPAKETRRLIDAIVDAIDGHYAQEAIYHCKFISTLDDVIDETLGGGIATGHLPEPRGLCKAALYISTESPLQTNRLQQIKSNHTLLASLPAADLPSLERVLSIQAPDLESQEHIIRYQVPVAIARHDIGLLIIDSVTANYRAEFDNDAGSAMAKRSAQLIGLGQVLSRFARVHNIAVVVANQVTDRFESLAVPSSNPLQTEHVTSSPLPEDDIVMTLDHQQNFFTGWGDGGVRNLKSPALGLVWTNQVAARIALLKVPVRPGSEKFGRKLKVVFAPWTGRSIVDYEVSTGGVRARGDNGTTKQDLEVHEAPVAD